MPFPTFETQDAIPEAFREEYEEREGKWVAKAPEVDDAGLRETLEKERAARATAERQLKAADSAKATAEREREAYKAQIGDVDGKVKALLEKVETQIAEAVAERDKEIETLNGKLRTVTLDDKAKAVFLKQGGRAEKADAALVLNKHRLDLVEDRIVVKDDKGEVSTTSIEDFWGKQYRAEMPEFYTGTKAGGGAGSGGTPSGSTNGTTGALTFEQIAANPGLAFDAANTASASN